MCELEVRFQVSGVREVRIVRTFFILIIGT